MGSDALLLVQEVSSLLVSDSSSVSRYDVCSITEQDSPLFTSVVEVQNFSSVWFTTLQNMDETFLCEKGSKYECKKNDPYA